MNGACYQPPGVLCALLPREARESLVLAAKECDRMVEHSIEREAHLYVVINRIRHKYPQFFKNVE